jgi:hypothetical protein
MRNATMRWACVRTFGATAAGALTALSALSLSACSGAAGEDVGASSDALEGGEYVSIATGVADATYIGDWEHDWGYVLGYLLPGAKIYAQVVTEDSVYGLIGNSGYGAWDHGHHCGWVSLAGVRGSGTHSSVADICPPPDNDFSLAHGQPSGLFRAGSVVESNGEVQPAIVLPTCPDFTVYANYDPVTHTFHDADGAESPGRGTPGYSVPQQAWVSGYSGFGTRFLSADGEAVEIKDTQRGGPVTAFGFMHAACIAGTHVGNPSPSASVPAPAPAPELHCCVRCANRQDGYRADTSNATCAQAAVDFCDAAGKDRGGVVDVYQGDCPDAP